MFKKFKNMKIKSKLLTLMLLITIIPQFIIGIIAYREINSFSDKAENFSNSLGQSVSDNCYNFCIDQAKSSNLNLTVKYAQSINNTLKKASEQVEILALALETIYQNKNRFSKFLLPLPEITEKSNSEDRNTVQSSMFAVDKENSNDEKILSYNIADYKSFSEKNIYKTSLKDYLNLEESKITDILKNSAIVSNNYVPSSLLEEMKLLSNIKYVAKPLYSTNIDLENIYVGTKTGIRYSCSSFNNYVRYLPSRRAWYKDAVSAYEVGSNSPVWQSTYISLSSGKYCITCSKVFRDSQGKILGVVGIDMDLSKINEEVAKTNEEEGGFAFIADHEGKMVSSRNYESDDFDKEPLKNKNITESHRKLLSNMIEGKTGVSETRFSYDNKDYLTSYAPIGASNWSLCVETPINKFEKIATDVKGEVTNSIISSLNKLKKTSESNNWFYLLFFLVLIFISTLLSFALSKLIADPILLLTSGAKDIGSGNFNKKIKIESRDEIGELSREFNKMGDDLQNYVSKLKKTTVEKVKLNSELNVAKTIQEDMLPCIFPKFSNQKSYDIFATMNPAKAVGGDFYDFFLIDKDHIGLVISDVSGKSISAALFMVITKTLIKNYVSLGFSPEKVFDVVNKQLCENNKAEMFVTSFIAIVNLKTGEIKYCNAGHNKPLVYKKSENKFSWLNTKHGFVLAGIDTVRYKSETLNMQPGDALYLYTDGVTEAINEKKELYSDERLISVLNSLNIEDTSSKEILEFIKKDIEKFSGTEPQADDITMLIFKYLG